VNEQRAAFFKTLELPRVFRHTTAHGVEHVTLVLKLTFRFKGENGE